MNALIDVAGWTLVSFVWQGALIAAAAAGVLRLARQAPATVRYAVACGALVAMLVAPALTAWSRWKPVSGMPFVLVRCRSFPIGPWHLHLRSRL